MALQPDGAAALQEVARGPGVSGGALAPFVDGSGMDQAFSAASNPATHRRFVEFVGVEQGDVVVEVGAGTGRLTFDGGLAQAIGRGGLLLVTDPAPAYLRVIEAKRAAVDAEWVHLLPARAEHLPLADSQADLTLGAKFLQYCDAPAALREMARVTRPGGTIALLAGTRADFSLPWKRVIAPLAAAAPSAARGLNSLYHQPGRVAELCAEAGLTEVAWVRQDEAAMSPDLEVTLRALSQLSFFEGFVAELPAPRRNALVEQAYRDLHEMFATTEPEERCWLYHWEFVRARVAGR